MMTQDPFDNMTEAEAEALRKAEWRSMPQANEEHAFSSLPRVSQDVIFGTYFSSYDNSGQDSNVSEEYRHIPLLLHSEKNRFAMLCDMAMKNWIPEFDHVLYALEENEVLLNNNQEPDEETAWKLTSFGLEVAQDSYIVGFPGRNSPLIMRKDFLQQILQFIAIGLCEIPARSILPYDPESVYKQFLTKVTLDG